MGASAWRIACVADWVATWRTNVLHRLTLARRGAQRTREYFACREAATTRYLLVSLLSPVAGQRATCRASLWPRTWRAATRAGRSLGTPTGSCTCRAQSAQLPGWRGTSRLPHASRSRPGARVCWRSRPSTYKRSRSLAMPETRQGGGARPSPQRGPVLRSSTSRPIGYDERPVLLAGVQRCRSQPDTHPPRPCFRGYATPPPDQPRPWCGRSSAGHLVQTVGDRGRPRRNGTYVNTSPKESRNSGGGGLYRAFGGVTDATEMEQALLWVLKPVRTGGTPARRCGTSGHAVQRDRSGRRRLAGSGSPSTGCGHRFITRRFSAIMFKSLEA